jgi:hypothetical protein
MGRNNTMMFKTKDGTFQHPEIVALRVTLTYSQYVAITEYSVIEHEKRDSVVELWLAGKVRLCLTKKEAEDILSKEHERDNYVR